MLRYSTFLSMILNQPNLKLLTTVHVLSFFSCPFIFWRPFSNAAWCLCQLQSLFLQGLPGLQVPPTRYHSSIRIDEHIDPWGYLYECLSFRVKARRAHTPGVLKVQYSYKKSSPNFAHDHTEIRKSKVFHRQHCRLTICIELVELTNRETAAMTPSGGEARSLRSLSSLETGSGWRFLVN